jgi:hypothetical protein
MASFSPNNNNSSSGNNIRRRSMPPISLLGIRVSSLSDVLEMLGGVDNLRGKTTTQVKDIVLDLTGPGRSLCDMMGGENGTVVVAEANWFVSHAWSYNFLDVMEAIQIFVEKEYGTHKKDEPVIWFDLFSSCQHGIQERPFEWWSDTFQQAIGKLHNVLMILEPWDNPVALTRAWCVFEVFACVSTKSRFEVSMSRAETARFMEMIATGDMASKIHCMLSKIDSAMSSAFCATDRDNIHHAIETLLPLGFIELDSMVLRVIEGWMLKILKECVRIERAPGRLRALRLCYSRLLYLQGRQKEALLTAEKCYETLEKHMGKDHVDTLSALHHLADVHVTDAKYGMAQLLYSNCLDARRRVLGAEHSETLKTMGVWRRYISFRIASRKQNHYTNSVMISEEDFLAIMIRTR